VREYYLVSVVNESVQQRLGKHVVVFHQQHSCKARHVSGRVHSYVAILRLWEGVA